MIFGGEDSNLTNTLLAECVYPYTIAQKHVLLPPYQIYRRADRPLPIPRMDAGDGQRFVRAVLIELVMCIYPTQPVLLDGFHQS